MRVLPYAARANSSLDCDSNPHLDLGAMSNNPLSTGLIPLHIVYHAAKGEIFGQEMIDELREHGYRIGPGTLYPMLHRLEEHGYLRAREAAVTCSCNIPMKS